MNKEGQKFAIYILAIFLSILSVVTLIIGFFDYDRSRIKTSVFVECNVSGNLTNCESFIRPDEMPSIIEMSTLEPKQTHFVNTPFGPIYEYIVYYEMLVNGIDLGAPSINIDLLTMDKIQFDVKINNIEYKWYFKSRLGTLYRMFNPHNPSIVKLKSNLYVNFSMALFSSAMCLFAFGWIKSHG